MRGFQSHHCFGVCRGPALEETNNKIKTMQRQAYGFRDPEFFKLKIFALHDTHYALGSV